MSPLSPDNDLTDDPERAGHESSRLAEQPPSSGNPQASDRPNLAGWSLEVIIRDAEDQQLAHNASIAPANLPQDPDRPGEHVDDGNYSIAHDTDDTATLSEYNERAENETGNKIS